MHEAIDGLEQEGAAVRRPYYLSVLAIALARAGLSAKARRTLAEAEERVHATEERWWAPEIARLKSLLEPSHEDRVCGLRHAVDLASKLRARPLAARSAVSLAHALAGRGHRHDAREALARVLAGSTPRSDDRDRRRAERMLTRLSA
ncbi:MAG: hypothetical protein P8Y13_10225 [Deinococcales bacterium]